MPPQTVIIHHLKDILFRVEALVGPVKRGVFRNDADIILPQQPFPYAFWLSLGLVRFLHELNLLDQPIFRQDEIWFAEKKP